MLNAKFFTILNENALTDKLAISNNIKRTNHESLSNLTLLDHETLILVKLLSHHYFWVLQHYNRPSDSTF